MMQKYSLDFFSSKGWSFVLIKNEKIIYKSRSRGLKPLIFCLKRHKKQIKEAVVFDKVIGGAGALLLTNTGIKEVWTITASKAALKIFKNNGIKISYKKLVNNILNHNGNDLCPMEKLSKGKNREKFCKISGIEI